MKEMNFYGCESLSMNEAMVIEGGDAYEAGYAIGALSKQQKPKSYNRVGVI